MRHLADAVRGLTRGRLLAVGRQLPHEVVAIEDRELFLTLTVPGSSIRQGSG